MPPTNSLAASHSLATAAESPTNHKDRSVTKLIGDLADALESAIDEISEVNTETKILSLNAQIEAARAGSSGAAFSVVAAEMQRLSNRTAEMALQMASRTRDKTSELTDLIDRTIRGVRLSDLALVNVDLIDRNLYERTCDVRWWATDGSLTDALSDPTEERLRFASERLGVILDAYTVYYDLVLCDAEGKVVANGRPGLFHSVGMQQSDAPWFQQAIHGSSGDAYGFQSAHASKLVDHKTVLIYSCGVRESGRSSGPTLGSLGILFNWHGLAGPLVNDIPVRQAELPLTSAYIVDDRFTVLASNRETEVGQSLKLPEIERILGEDKGHYCVSSAGKDLCVGFAKSPGFETYSTGWHSLVVQEI